MHINFTGLGVISNLIWCMTHIVATFTPCDSCYQKSLGAGLNISWTRVDPCNIGHRETSCVAMKSYIITLSNWSTALLDCQAWFSWKNKYEIVIKILFQGFEKKSLKTMEEAWKAFYGCLSFPLNNMCMHDNALG